MATLLPQYESNAKSPAHSPSYSHCHHGDEFKRHTSFTDTTTVLRTKRFRILLFSLLLFLGSLWLMMHFGDSYMVAYSVRTIMIGPDNTITNGIIHDQSAAIAAIDMDGGMEEGWIINSRVSLDDGVSTLDKEIEAVDSSQQDLGQEVSILVHDSIELLKTELHEENAEELGRSVDLVTEIKQIITNNKVVVFSETFCPHSSHAKAILDGYDIEYFVLEVDLRDDSWKIKEILSEFTSHNTFPNVFIDGVSIGGSNEVSIMDQSGALAKALKGVAI